MVFTASNVLLKTLASAGITHAFVNLGSDHPALLEALATRQESGIFLPEIVTCPNEMVALSAAQGYAQVTGKPAAVIVHVDCGTQALAGAIHNVDRSRTPVFIYAGASPYTVDGELVGSRNEWIFPLQDITDQSAIVRQYMRHTALIRTGRNISQVVLRALTFAKSEPRGPVYCYAGRETMEEELDESVYGHTLDMALWNALEPSGLSDSVVQKIAIALIRSQNPLVITSYLGRNPESVALLVKLSDLLAIPVFCSCPSTVNFPADHPNFVGLKYGVGKYEWLEKADTVLVLDSDIPWIPLHTKPRPNAAVFHIDVDPLKQNINVSHIEAHIRCRADSSVALSQLIAAVRSHESYQTVQMDITIKTRRVGLEINHANMETSLKAREVSPAPDERPTVPYVLSVLGSIAPTNTLFMNESISNYPLVWEHLRPSIPGSFLTSGATSLGWALGACIGAILGSRVQSETRKYDLTCALVGDGSFLFGVPSTAYWIARRYDTPFLTIIWNNGGWRSPKLSMLGVHPSGVGASVASKELHVTFGPDAPDYGKIAEAAGGAWSARVERASQIVDLLREAIRVVLEERKCAVLEIVLEPF